MYSFLLINKYNYLRDEIFHVISCDETISKILFNFNYNKRQIEEILKIIYEKSKKINNIFYERNFIYKILKSLDNEYYDYDLELELGMKCLKGLTDHASKLIIKNIDEDNFDDKNATNLSFCLLAIMNQYPGLFHTLKIMFQKMLKKINYERLFKVVGIDMLYFFTEFPISFFFEYIDIEWVNFNTFFKYPICYESNFGKDIQKKLIEKFNYPSVIPNLSDSINLSLLNSSISKRLHFVDLINKSLTEYLAIGDLDTVKVGFGQFIDFIPYFIVNNHSIIYSDFELYKEMFSLVQNENTNISRLISMFKNDDKLIKFLISGLKIDVNEYELVRKSIPYIAKDKIKDFNYILENEENEFFAINKVELQNDFDFLRITFILYLILSMVNNSNHITTETIKIIEQNINLIKNKIYQEYVIIDIFSIIFLKDDENFVCSSNLTSEIIKLLASLNKNPFINGAFYIYKNSQTKKIGSKIENWFQQISLNFYDYLYDKNWEKANEMSLYLPYLQDLYLKAYNMEQLISNNKEPYNKILYLEKYLTCFDENLEYDFSDYQELIKIHNKILYPLQLEKWKETNNLVSFVEYTSTFIEKIKFIKQNKNKFGSSSLSKFVHYISLYYSCSSLNSSITFESINDIFNFDLKASLSGPFNIGEYEQTQKLANLFKIDLIEFILNNLNVFHITNDFLQNLLNKYPLETIALSITKKIEIKVNHNYQKLYKYFKEENKEPNSNYIFEILKNPNDYDDLLYKIDHKELYKILKEFDDYKLANQYYEIFIFISYVELEDEAQIGKIRFLHNYNIHSSSKTSTKIIKKLINSNNFEAVLEYLKYCVPKSNLSSLLCYVFDFFSSNISKIEQIFITFPKKFDLLLSRFYYIKDIIPLFVKYKTNSMTKYIKLLVNLPENIIQDSNLFVFSTIIESFSNNIQSIFSINEDLASFFSDENLINLICIVSEKSFFYQIKVCAFLQKFFRNRQVLIDYVKNSFEIYINNIKVDSIQKEHEITNKLNLIYITLSDFGVQKIQSLIIFLSYSPFSKLHKTYSLGSLTDLFKIAFLLDSDELLTSMASSFNYSLTNYYYIKSFLMMNIGLYTEAIKIIQEKKLLIDEFEEVDFYDKSYYYLTPLIHQPFFCVDMYVVDQIDDRNLTNISLYQQLKDRLKKKENSLFSQKLTSLIALNCNIEHSISFLISINNYNAAYQKLMSIEENELRAKLFIHNMYFSSLQNANNKELEAFLFRCDPELQITKNIWDSLLLFYREKEMNYSMYYYYSIHDKFEEAVKTCFGFSQYCDDIDTKIIFTSNALNCINKLLSCLENKIETVPIFKANTTSIETIYKHKNIIELQLRIYRYCIKQKINYVCDLTSDNKKSTIKIGTILFSRHSYSYVNDIVKYTTVSIEEIYKKFSKQMIKKPVEKIIKFIKVQKRHINDPKFINILLNILIEYKHLQVKEIIDTCLSKDEERCKYFIQFNFLSDALLLAEDNNFNKLIPLIAIKASWFGDKEIYDCCNTFFVEKLK